MRKMFKFWWKVEFERHFLWSFKVFQHFKKVLCQEQKLLKILLICHNWSHNLIDTHSTYLFLRGQQKKVLVFCPFYCFYYLSTSIEFQQNFYQSSWYCFDWSNWQRRNCKGQKLNEQKRKLPTNIFVIFFM